MTLSNASRLPSDEWMQGHFSTIASNNVVATFCCLFRNEKPKMCCIKLQEIVDGICWSLKIPTSSLKTIMASQKLYTYIEWNPLVPYGWFSYFFYCFNDDFFLDSELHKKNGKKLFCRLCQLPDNVIRYLLLIVLLIKNYVYAVYSCREMRQVYNNLLWADWMNLTFENVFLIWNQMNLKWSRLPAAFYIQ